MAVSPCTRWAAGKGQHAKGSPRGLLVTLTTRSVCVCACMKRQMQASGTFWVHTKFKALRETHTGMMETSAFHTAPPNTLCGPLVQSRNVLISGTHTSARTTSGAHRIARTKMLCGPVIQNRDVLMSGMDTNTTTISIFLTTAQRTS